LFSVKAEPKVKKEEKKKQVEINEVKETKEKKRVGGGNSSRTVRRGFGHRFSTRSR